MATKIPSAAEVRERLSALDRGQIPMLARDSGVPVTTLINIRDSDKPQGPTVETLRKFWPHLVKLTAKKATAL